MATGSNLDSNHNTLIGQMVAEQGCIPSDYLPFVPLATFSYHYGYHAFISLIGIGRLV